MNYDTIRLIHITSVVISITLFTIRGLLQIQGVAWRRWHLLRSAPHLNDTILLTAAIALAVQSGQYPLQMNWLTAKVVALLLYIGIGSVALKPQTSQSTRIWAFAASLACVGYIVLVALTRSPVLRLIN